jgi:hypothetical protein
MAGAPGHTTPEEGVVPMLMVGRLLTVTVAVVVEEQLFASVPVTV